MQGLAPVCLLLVGLAAALPAAANPGAADYIIRQNGAPVKSLAAPGATARPATMPPAARPAVPLAAPAAQAARIAVLLPLQEAGLRDAAEVVKKGILAAHATDGGPELVMFDTDGHNVPNRYRDALAAGVRVVIGPLTRENIVQLAPQVSVPTLALNSLERVTSNPKLYALSLNVDNEARQLARQLREDGRVRPLVLTGASALDRRLAAAFSGEWKVLNAGKAPASSTRDDPQLAARLHDADSVFLALADDSDVPAASGDLPRYATSQLATRGATPAQLAGAHLVDMPWFLMPEHPAVKRYPRPAEALTRSTERLYALGIDAYRLAVQMQDKPLAAGFRLDGVTGDLKLARDRQFNRELPVTVLDGAKP